MQFNTVSAFLIAFSLSVESERNVFVNAFHSVTIAKAFNSSIRLAHNTPNKERNKQIENKIRCAHIQKHTYTHSHTAEIERKKNCELEKELITKT